MSITVERVLRGDAEAAGRAIHAGGELGCDLLDYGEPDLQAGRRYVLLFAPLVGGAGPAEDAMLLLGAWPVSDDDRVSVPGREPIPLERLVRRIDSDPAP
jgi:hypothetical protein